MKRNIKYYLYVFCVIVLLKPTPVNANPQAIFIGDSRTVNIVGGWQSGKSPYNSSKLNTIYITKTYYKMLRDTNDTKNIILKNNGEKYNVDVRGVVSFFYQPIRVPRNPLRNYVAKDVDIQFIMAEYGEKMKQIFTHGRKENAALISILEYANRYRKGAYVFIAIGYNDFNSLTSIQDVKILGETYSGSVNSLAMKYNNLHFCVVGVYFRQESRYGEKNIRITEFNKIVRNEINDSIKYINLDVTSKAIINNNWNGEPLFTKDRVHITNDDFQKYIWDIIWRQTK